MDCENAAARERRVKEHRKALKEFVRQCSNRRIRLKSLCFHANAMAVRFGGIDRFLDFWWAEFNAACERRPGSRFVLANFRMIANIRRLAAAQRTAQAAGSSLGDVGDLSDDDLQCELVRALAECEGVEIPEQDAFADDEDEPEPSNTAPRPAVVTEELPVATCTAVEETAAALQVEPSEPGAEVSGRVAFPHDLVKTEFTAAVHRVINNPVLNRHSAPPTCHLHPDVSHALRNGPRGYRRTEIPYGVALIEDPDVPAQDAKGEFHFVFKDERGRSIPHR